jgi:hypothetical protein
MEENQSAGETSVKESGSFLKSLLLVVLALVIGGGLVYGVAKKKPEFLGLPKGSAQIQSEVDSLISEVDKLIVLPADEKPTVVTITDVEKVKDQPFFRNAKNGDKVLIYTNAKKAILYRQSEKKVIEVGAVNINQVSPSASSTPGAVEVGTPQPQASPQQ